MSDDAPQRRLAGLEAVFRRIATTRMRGVPVLNPALSVQAIGFGPDPLRTAPDAAPTMLGVLVTPWFMNLLRLPLQPVDGRDAAALQATRIKAALLEDLQFAMLPRAGDPCVDMLDIGAGAFQVLHKALPAVDQGARDVGQLVVDACIEQQSIEVGGLQWARGLALVDQRMQ